MRALCACAAAGSGAVAALVSLAGWSLAPTLATAKPEAPGFFEAARAASDPETPVADALKSASGAMGGILGRLAERLPSVALASAGFAAVWAASDWLYDFDMIQGMSAALPTAVAAPTAIWLWRKWRPR